MNEEDQVFRRYILDIACKGFTLFRPVYLPQLLEWTLPRLRELEQEGLVRLDDEGVYLTETGWSFLRHVCKAFDLHLLRAEKTGGNNMVRCGKSAFNGMSAAPGL